MVTLGMFLLNQILIWFKNREAPSNPSDTRNMVLLSKLSSRFAIGAKRTPGGVPLGFSAPILFAPITGDTLLFGPARREESVANAAEPRPIADSSFRLLIFTV